MRNNDECSALNLFMHIKDKCMWNRFIFCGFMRCAIAVNVV